MNPSLKRDARSMCSSRLSGATSPRTVPASTRCPGAKTASGASVIGSTTSSPRMPCAFRTRPTITNSASPSRWAGALMRASLGGAALGRVRALAHWHRARLERAAEPLLVTRLENARAAKQGAHRVRGQGAIVEPVVHALGLEVERSLTLTRRILADDLDELAVSWAPRVGDDDTKHRGLLPARTAKSN